MKKTFAILLIAALVMMNACSSSEGGTVTEQSKTETVTDNTGDTGDTDDTLLFSVETVNDTREYKTEDGAVYYVATVNYPKIVTQYANDFIDRINSGFAQDAEDILVLSQDEQNMYKADYDEVNQFHKGETGKFTSADLEYGVTYCRDGLLSLYILDSIFNAGAVHGGSVKTGYTYDLKNGTELTYTGLLGADKETIKQEVCRLFIDQNEREEHYLFNNEDVYKYFDDIGWYLTSEGVLFFYGEYIVAAYVYHMPQQVIPLNFFRDSVD